jgi:ATP-dependent Clp protease ATP-binding subunit ClpC
VAAGDIIEVDVKPGTDEIAFSKGTGEIPAIEERIHLDRRQARESWTPGISAPAADGAAAAGA